MNYNPNIYAEKIYDAILHTNENIVINAVAGAGKTTTLLKVMEMLPKGETLFVAFNKSIAEDIIKMLCKNTGEFVVPKHIKVSTCHALGLAILNDCLGDKATLNTWKYIARFNEIHTNEIFHTYGHNKAMAYESNVKKLIDYARYFLCETTEDVERVAKRYGLKLVDNEPQIVLELMDWGRNHMEEIDFTDMEWLPCIMNLSSPKYMYKYVLIDEAQDLSKMQQKLILSTFMEETRFVCAGDDFQCINAWAGADKDAFENYLSMPNTKRYPMPVTRRCAKKIVEYAKRFVPEIEALPDAPEGEVLFNVNPWEPSTQADMVGCRNNAPLMKYYMMMLDLNKNVTFINADFKNEYIKLLESTNSNILSLDFNDEGIFPELYRSLLKDIDKLIVNEKIDARSAYQSEDICNRYDAISSLEILAKGLTTKAELIDKIKSISSDRNNTGVLLTTIHKSKGKTIDNMYILGPSLIPSKLAEQDWEIEAERNLAYVAVTRARKKLCFISEEEFPVDNIFSNPEKTMKKIKEIEACLELLKEKKKVDRDISGNTSTKTQKKKFGTLKYKHLMK